MLFGVSFCRGCGRVKKRRPNRRFDPGLALLLLGAAVFTALLFLAPQWLLVVLVLALTCAVVALACANRD